MQRLRAGELAGVDPLRGALLGDLAVSVLYTAVDQWLDDEPGGPGVSRASWVARVLDTHAALMAVDPT